MGKIKEYFVEQGGLTPADIIPVAPTLCGCVALSRHRALVGGQRLVNQTQVLTRGWGLRVAQALIIHEAISIGFAMFTWVVRALTHSPPPNSGFLLSRVKQG